MKVTVFSSKPYDEVSFNTHNAAFGHELLFIANRLRPETAVIAAGSPAVCAFVNDVIDRPTLEVLADGGTRFIAMRCAGFNNVDLKAANELGIQVARVPAYSPHAVAEHTVALLLCINRHIHKAYNRVREGNFSLDGLLGMDLHGKTIGVLGTGTIGAIFARIMIGFGCKVIAHDIVQDPGCVAAGVRYVSLDELFKESHALSLHCPLLPETHHIIGAAALARMRDGVLIINTSRGALLDTAAVLAAIKRGRIGGLGLDVYEEESELFFADRSFEIIQDDVFMRLTTFPNVLITGHQGFFTHEALENIALTTLGNIADFAADRPCPNLIQM